MSRSSLWSHLLWWHHAHPGSHTCACHQEAGHKLHLAHRALCRQSDGSSRHEESSPTLWSRALTSVCDFLFSLESSMSGSLSAVYFNLSEPKLFLCDSRVERTVFPQPCGTCNLWLPCKEKSACVTALPVWCSKRSTTVVSTAYSFHGVDHGGPNLQALGLKLQVQCTWKPIWALYPLKYLFFF